MARELFGDGLGLLHRSWDSDVGETTHRLAVPTAGAIDIASTWAATGATSELPWQPVEWEQVARMRAVHERYFGALSHKAMLTRRALEQGVNFCYREPSDRERDSGWRMFHGNESDEYSNTVENVVLVPLRDVVDCDKSLTSLVKRPHGTVWEREPGSRDFDQVHDWEPLA